MARRYYSSTAARTTLASGVDDTTNTFTVNAVSGWPTSTPYTLIIDQDTVNEEIVEVTGRTGTTITVTRGVDGTSAVAHSSGAAVNHGVSARDFDEPNAFLNSGTWQLIDAKGDLVVGTASDTADRLAVGSNGYVLRADSTEATGLEWYDIATDLGLKFDKRPDQNLQTGSSYTFATSDDAKLITASAAASAVYTVPPQSSASWADDTVLRVINLGAGEVSFAGGSGVTVNNSAAKIAQYEGATVVRTGSDSWTLVPFGGAGDAVDAAVISSPAATGNYTDNDGVEWDYWTFNSTSSLTVGTAGQAQILVVGGGAGGGGGIGGGGGAGAFTQTTLDLIATTYTITVGGGGSGGTNTVPGSNGTNSTFSTLTGLGGGGGCQGQAGAVAGTNGGSGGGGRDSAAGGTATASLQRLERGSAGGTSAGSTASGAGGGASAVGGAGATNIGGAGGAGFSSNITGATVGYAGGGGGSAFQGTGGTASDGGGAGTGNDTVGVPGTANTGGGGGGGGYQTTGANGGNGGSGVVIVRVRAA